VAEPTSKPNSTEIDQTQPDAAVERRRRGPDVLTLLMGLICLISAVMTLAGWMPAMPMFDPRWLLAGGAILVGVLLLVASLRSPGARRARR
jgi:hypothetical protein